jgi:hypothetical protein
MSTARVHPAGRQEQRRHQRVKVDLLGRYMLEDREEYPCQVINMSPGGAAMIAPKIGRVGERIIAYIDYIGRIEGHLVRPVAGGFAMTVDATPRKRDKLAAQLTWLANRHVLNLPEDRRHDRFVPKNPFSKLVLPGGKELRCRIIDVSLSGAAIHVIDKPPIGTPVFLGQARAQVVRHFEDGIAVEFTTLHTRESLMLHFD